MVTTALRNSQPVQRFWCNWFVTQNLDQPWELRPNGSQVILEGDTLVDISIDFPLPPAKRQSNLPYLTAHRTVDAAPYICAARPGSSPPPTCRKS